MIFAQGVMIPVTSPTGVVSPFEYVLVFDLITFKQFFLLLLSSPDFVSNKRSF